MIKILQTSRWLAFLFLKFKRLFVETAVDFSLRLGLASSLACDTIFYFYTLQPVLFCHFSSWSWFLCHSRFLSAVSLVWSPKPISRMKEGIRCWWVRIKLMINLHIRELCVSAFSSSPFSKSEPSRFLWVAKKRYIKRCIVYTHCVQINLIA